jgi:Putative Flp pilus-assembly TadE/G-like
MTKIFRLMTKLYRKGLIFAKVEKGAVLPIVALAIVAVMALASLAMDVSRYQDLQTQLQNAADAFALAAAAELDGKPSVAGGPSAIDRANNAVNVLMANRNSSVFGSLASGPGGVNVTVGSITFYSALPPSDATVPIPGATADPTLARFVKVNVTPVTTTPFFSTILRIGAVGPMTAGASAVAGFSQAICKKTPIFVCNGNAGGPNDMMNPNVMRGREVSLVAPPGNAYGPGNYGFLDIGCGNNTPCLNQALGANNGLNGCIGLDPVTTTTGQKTASSRFFNTRFDLYEQDAKNANKATYSPDQNVRKGYQAPMNCNKPTSDGGWSPPNPPPQSTKELPMPDDSNITNYATATIGNGNWQGKFTTYWSVNFPGVGRPATPATRWDLYKTEITGNYVPDKSVGKEIGTPVCAPNNAQACNFADPTRLDACRRIIYAAVLDCSKLNGGQNTVIPEGVVTFFLLQPAQQTGGFGTMLSEYVGLARANDASGVLHDIVQLYR